jgi:thioredoxin reductase (NADPH)
LVATGRVADTSKLKLEAALVKTDKTGKIVCTKDDKTSNENIYAIGDVVVGRPELTPVAIKCG